MSGDQIEGRRERSNSTVEVLDNYGGVDEDSPVKQKQRSLSQDPVEVLQEYGGVNEDDSTANDIEPARERSSSTVEILDFYGGLNESDQSLAQQGQEQEQEQQKRSTSVEILQAYGGLSLEEQREAEAADRGGQGTNGPNVRELLNDYGVSQFKSNRVKSVHSIPCPALLCSALLCLLPIPLIANDLCHDIHL